MSFSSRVQIRFFVIVAFCFPLLGQSAVDLKPSPQQVEWQDLEMGAIIHFGPNTFLDQEWGDGSADPKAFNPTRFDPDQWMQALQAAGIVRGLCRQASRRILSLAHFTDRIQRKEQSV